MKIKEIDRTANIAWSPASSYPIYLAAGTAAQQLDSSFSTNSVLELYHFDVNQPGLDMPLKASLPCENRFHKVVWGSNGMGAEDKDKYTSGILVGGCEGGIMEVYDANRILEGEPEPLILSKNKHTGPVRALDFNSFRSYLIASGASDSEILIWDLNNPKTPMSPGAKAQPADDVTCLAWNKQVEHILASTFSTRCVVWDLRKNEPIIKVADSTARIRYKVVAWHPTVATQMCLASEDDTNPVIQLWDLRYATAPLKVLQGHERGVLGLAWCQDDPELLLSCGKDSRIHCWNPNYPNPGYEMVCDMQTSCQWSFDVLFCPRNPVVISTSSFDGRISVYGLSGGSQQPVTTSKLADSFPGMDMDISHTPIPAQKPASIHLRDAPKWLKRPCGASFAFGGKLIQFANVKQGTDLPDKRMVTVSQVVTLPDFIARSQKLEGALDSGALAEFCQQKSLEAADGGESKVWEFLQASFTPNSNEVFLSMLGFDSNQIHEKLEKVVSRKSESVDTITDGFVSLGRGAPDGFGAQLLPTDNGSIFDGISQASTRSVTPEPEKQFQIPTDDTTEGFLNQALVSGNLEYAVDICLKDCRWADALILASTGGPELIKKAQIKYFHKCENEASNMIRAVVTRDLRRLVERCDLDCWKQALATALTYADPAEFTYLADTLGRRLETSRSEKFRKSALLCYICCGNMNRLVESWASNTEKTHSPEHLQDVVEQVMVLRKAADVQGKAVSPVSPALAGKLVEYATLLVSQGCLQAALHYLEDATEPSMVSLKERVYYSLGLARPTRATIQPRSRQTSESSSSQRGLLTHKRPSFQQPSPSLANSVYDSRRPSGYFESPNLNSLTGPPVQPQAFDSGAQSYYNPLNVNVNQPSWPQPLQHTPGLGHSTGRRSSAANSPGSLPAPAGGLGSVSGWNDPPALKSAKPKVGGAQAILEPITHPIFGSAQPEAPGMPNNLHDSRPPTGYYEPSNPSAFRGPPPPAQFFNPGAQSTTYYNPSYVNQTAWPQSGVAPLTNQGPGIYQSHGAHQFSSPNPMASFPPPPPAANSMSAMPPPPPTGSMGSFQGSSSMSSLPPPPPTASSMSSFSPAGPMAAFPHPPALSSASSWGDYSHQKNPGNAGVPYQNQGLMGNPSAPPLTSFGPPFAPPPAISSGFPPSTQALASSQAQLPPPSSPRTQFAPPPSLSGNPFAPPPSSSGNKFTPPPSLTGNHFAPPPSSTGSHFAPPPSSSGSHFAPPPSSSGNQFAPPTSSSGNQFAPPTSSSGSHFAPPLSSPGSNFAPPPSSSGNQFAPPPSPSVTQFAPPTSSSGNQFAPPTSTSATQFAPPSSLSGNQFAPPPSSSPSQFAPPSSSSTTQFAPPTSSSGNKFAPPTSTQGNQFAQPPSSSPTHFAPPTSSSGNQFAPPTSSFGNQFAPPTSSSGNQFPPPTSSSGNQFAPPTSSSGNEFARPESASESQFPTSSSSGAEFPPVSSSKSESQFPPPMNSSGAEFAPPSSSSRSETQLYSTVPTAAKPMTPEPYASVAPPPLGSAHASVTPATTLLTTFGQSFTPAPISSGSSSFGPSFTSSSSALPPPTFGSYAPPPASVLPPSAQSYTPAPPPAMGSVQPPAACAPIPRKTEPEPKGLVPPEHEELLEVLEKLRSECYATAAQPQMKRKLEDVGRKLELLRDKLRDGSLSAKTLDSLHNMIGALKNKDYHFALGVHTQLVTAGNFAEISSFLPAIKVLIQSATQLGVYI